MNLNLTGKTALVGGSTQGIGRAVAMALAQAGATVILLARNEAALVETTQALPIPNEQKHSFIVADFSKPTELQAAVKAKMQELGGAIHILINNTGGPAGGPIAEANVEAFLAAYQQHLVCNHLLAQAVLPGMKAEGYGRIVNIVSTSVREPIKGLGVSNTTRGAVASWAKTLATEVASFGVTVNNVLPGATRTQRLTSLISAKSQKTGLPESVAEDEMLSHIPAGRFAEPEELADAVLFLASPSAAYITGVSLPVDGGRMHCI